ncbi:permease [Gemmatirosa kalamazoonensis]|uniref:Permease n=1 Tax=Gemmatirosa kalamazoonensis TaxID=861299 RepID=W0RBY8_9BACT|nr:ABC transporter permease [Gemmatirosa kalamazoonensis]AHG87967.1 permease [Gemmatirosa kalamazoonensis]
MSAESKVPLWRRYRRFWGPDAAADVDDELAFHLEQRVADLVAAGLAPDAARREAAQRIGDLDALKRSVVAIDESDAPRRRALELLGTVGADARLALRGLRRNPIVALVSVLTLALGIGANAAIFGVVYAVLLRPLPYVAADRMTVVTETQGGSRTGAGPGQYTEWVRRNRAFEALSAQTWTSFNLSGPEGDAERVVGAIATPSLFRTHVMKPEAGRYFLPEEAQPGRDHVVVLSHALYVERFGGDPKIVGRAIRLNDQPYTVVGVAPDGFTLQDDAERLWVPLVLTAKDEAIFSDHWLTVFGTLRPGVSIEAAQRDMERVSREIAALHPTDMVARSARVIDYREDLAEYYRRQLAVLLGAVGFILLLACLNVAGLLLARLSGRRKELAIRVALGAGRARVMRQLVTEAMVLALAGGVAALLVARITVRALLAVAPAGVPRLSEGTAAAAALLFAVVPTLVSGMLLGALSAARGVRGGSPQTLRAGGRDAGATPRDRMRSALVVGQIALALALLAGAGLFVRSARNLGRVDLGFRADRLVSAHVTLAGTRYDTPEHLTAGAARLLDRLRALPGVQSVAASTSLPLADNGPDAEVHVEGREYPAGQAPYADFRIVTPGYFETMGISIVRGRTFTPDDRAGAPPVAIISASLARRLWPNESALGKRFSCCVGDGVRVWREVVGVSRDVRHYLTDPPRDEMYVPYEQTPPQTWIWFGNGITLVARTVGDAGPVLPNVRRAVAAVDPTLPVYDLRTYDDLRRIASAQNRFATLLFSAFALLALTLAAVGIYGVLAYLVAQRTAEIAVRLAIGARRRDVLALVLQQGARLAAVGMMLGLALAAAGSRALASLLFGVQPTDPLTYTVVVVALGAVALAACLVPARRASAVEPHAVLRS